MLTLSDSQVQQLRLRGQRLQPRQSASKTSTTQVVADVCGVQAQEVEAGMLSIRVRCNELAKTDVVNAQEKQKTIVRTWMMRGTLHLVAADDLPWMLFLLGPVFIQSGRKRRLELGLDEETGERGVRLLRDLLGERGPLTKAEIAQELSAKGIPMEGQASIHLIGLAALQGWVCHGPPSDKKDTFVLIEDWLGKKFDTSPDKGIEELVHCYLSAFAPASLKDFVAWSGLPVRDCRAAWEQMAAQTVEVKMGNATVSILKSQLDRLDSSTERKGHPVVRLLPRYDTYLLGYNDRSLIIDPEYVKRIYPGGGLIHPALLVDGKVAGTWKVIRKRERMEVEVESFVKLTLEVQEALEAEGKKLAHFWGLPTEMKCNPSSS